MLKYPSNILPVSQCFYTSFLLDIRKIKSRLHETLHKTMLVNNYHVFTNEVVSALVTS